MDAMIALGDPTRRKIIELIGGGERAAGDIAAAFSISAPAISQHLRVLREAKLVRVRPEAQRRLYTLDPRGFDAIDAWIGRYRIFWNRRLDRLASALEEKADA